MQSKMKLESILRLVSRRNTALYGMLQKPRVKKDAPLGSVTDSQFGYNWTHPLPRPELEQPKPQGMVPQREVVMKIPICTIGRQHMRQKSYSHKDRDPWVQVNLPTTRSPTRISNLERDSPKAFAFYSKPINADHNRRESTFIR
jgi:hypothetical protein